MGCSSRGQPSEAFSASVNTSPAIHVQPGSPTSNGRKPPEIDQPDRMASASVAASTIPWEALSTQACASNENIVHLNFDHSTYLPPVMPARGLAAPVDTGAVLTAAWGCRGGLVSGCSPTAGPPRPAPATNRDRPTSV